jgi:hypothetical protein
MRTTMCPIGGGGGGVGVGVGVGDGVSVGVGEGDGVSVGVGPGDGVSDGPGDGESVGPGDGESVGPGDGESVGPGDGESVGPGDGESVGPGEGESVGPGDGESVGAGDGDGLGSTEIATPVIVDEAPSIATATESDVFCASVKWRGDCATTRGGSRLSSIKESRPDRAPGETLIAAVQMRVAPRSAVPQPGDDDEDKSMFNDG